MGNLIPGRFLVKALRILFRLYPTANAVPAQAVSAPDKLGSVSSTPPQWTLQQFCRPPPPRSPATQRSSPSPSTPFRRSAHRGMNTHKWIYRPIHIILIFIRKMDQRSRSIITSKTSSQLLRKWPAKEEEDYNIVWNTL
jgi:hypothetical protein